MLPPLGFALIVFLVFVRRAMPPRLPPLGFALIGLPRSVPGPSLALQTRTHTFTFMPCASLSFCAALQWSSACMLSPSKAHWTMSAKGSLSGAVTAAALSHNTQFL
jgi:hypothetical protein